MLQSADATEYHQAIGFTTNGPNKIRERTLYLVVLAACIGLQLFIATAGTWRFDFGDGLAYTSDRSAQLADGFAHGHLHLMTIPPPELAQLADPYNYEEIVRAGIPVIFDASYFNGRYYLYWGPVPALLLTLPVRLGLLPPTMPDSILLLVFAGWSTVALGGVIWHLRTVYAPGLPVFLPLSALVAGALAGPWLVMVGRPAVYEVAIFGAQAFLISGLWFALRAADRRGRPGLAYALASVAWVAAVGTRATLVPCVAFLTLAFAYREFRRCARGAAIMRGAALLGPLVLGGVGLALYNQVRFGAWWETGQRYQLTGSQAAGMAAVPMWESSLSTSVLIANLANYLLRPFQLLERFPYLGWLPRADAPPDQAYTAWFPEHYSSLDAWPFTVPNPLMEPIVGIVWIAPYVLLTLSLVFLVRPLRKREARPPVTSVAERRKVDQRWLVLILGVAAALAAGPVLAWRQGITLRYAADFSALLLILSFLAVCLLGLRSRRRWPPIALAIVLALFTAAEGTSVGISSVCGHFQRHNPALVLSIDPDSALARFKAGQLAAQSGHEDAALGHWRRATELEAHGISASESAMSLGSVYGRRGMLDQAAYWFELAAAKRPSLSTWALTWLARMYSMNGRALDAIATYERALGNISSMDVPDLATAFRELAANYDQVGLPDKAAATRDRARALGLR